MQITQKRRVRLQAVSAQLLLGIAGLALVTFVCCRLEFGLARTGFAYVILIALVSLLGSFSASVVLSIVAAACLNFFFAPPLFEFRIDVPEDIERIAVFLTTSLVVTALTTRRKRVEKELAESKAKLEEAQRIAHFGWWERDFTTNQVDLSDEVCRTFGVQPLELPEWHGRWLKLIHPEDRPRAAEAAAAALLPGGERYDVEYRVVRPDGTERIVHSQGDVTWDESRRPLRQFGVLQDITELRQTEKELRASEARFRTFVDHATDAFFLLDDDWTVLDVNRQACESLGYSREELIGKHRSDFDVGLDETSIAAPQAANRRRGGDSRSKPTTAARMVPHSRWRFASANLSKADAGSCAWCVTSPSVSRQRMSCARARSAFAPSFNSPSTCTGRATLSTALSARSLPKSLADGPDAGLRNRQDSLGSALPRA